MTGPLINADAVSLSLPQIALLLSRLEEAEHAPCAAAVVLMLWGGVKFNELKAWTWLDILEETPRSASTHLRAEARARMLRAGFVGMPGTPILPRGWNRRWLRLKQQLGIQDARVLRETHRLLAGCADFWRVLGD